MHYSHVSCTGAEDRLTQCAKTSISLTFGKTTYINHPAAAVSCHGSPPLNLLAFLILHHRVQQYCMQNNANYG